MALLERVNRGRVATWLKSLVASVTIVHTAVFLRLLLADSSGQTIDWIDCVLVICICAGLFALPSAMLHAALRLHVTGMLANPVRDLRYGILYLPLIATTLANRFFWQPIIPCSPHGWNCHHHGSLRFFRRTCQ